MYVSLALISVSVTSMKATQAAANLLLKKCKLSTKLRPEMIDNHDCKTFLWLKGKMQGRASRRPRVRQMGLVGRTEGHLELQSLHSRPLSDPYPTCNY